MRAGFLRGSLFRRSEAEAKNEHSRRSGPDVSIPRSRFLFRVRRLRFVADPRDKIEQLAVAHAVAGDVEGDEVQAGLRVRGRAEGDFVRGHAFAGAAALEQPGLAC